LQQKNLLWRSIVTPFRLETPFSKHFEQPALPAALEPDCPYLRRTILASEVAPHTMIATVMPIIRPLLSIVTLSDK
jgi:hypothetical protein